MLRLRYIQYYNRKVTAKETLSRNFLPLFFRFCEVIRLQSSKIAWNDYVDTHFREHLL